MTTITNSMTQTTNHLTTHSSNGFEDSPVTHVASSALNHETRAPDKENTPGKIYGQMLISTFTRPFEIFFKTIYHLCLPVSIPIAIFNANQEAKNHNYSMEQFAQNCEFAADESIDKEEVESLHAKAGSYRAKILTPEQSNQEITQAVYDNVTGIVRTPLYGSAMLVVNVSALIIGPLLPTVLYDLKEVENRLSIHY